MALSSLGEPETVRDSSPPILLEDGVWAVPVLVEDVTGSDDAIACVSVFLKPRIRL